MPVTSPDQIFFADGGTDASVADITSTMATSIQTALNSRQIKTYRWPTITERNAETGMVAGDEGYQVDTGRIYRFTTSWQDITGNASTVIPSVSISGAGFSINQATGAVSLNAVTSATFDNVFLLDSTYEIEIEGIQNALGNISMQLRTSLPATDTSLVYDVSNFVGAGTTTTSTQTLAANNWGLVAGSSLMHEVSLKLIGARELGPTFGRINAVSTQNPMVSGGSGSSSAQKVVLHRNSAAMTGFVLTMNGAGATFTGKVAITRKAR